MLRTKREVDKHVSDILKKIPSECERNLRGFNFAKLYYQCKDYETAKKYIAGFLSVRDNHSPSHKLLGQVHEAAGNIERALQSYKRSLELDDSQKDVVLKICELYCQLPVDSETARYWADRADKLFPRHSAVFRLRECIMNAEGEPNLKDLEALITNELIVRPRDVSLRIKLLKLYMDSERVLEAYNYAIKVEMKKPFSNSVDWYHCLVDIFQAYQDECGGKTDFHITYLVILEHLVMLTLAEPHAVVACHADGSKYAQTVAGAVSALQMFDQQLARAFSQPEPKEGAWGYVLNHMRGNLYLFMATLYLKRALKKEGNWKEACRVAAGLLFTAYTFKPGNLLQEAWFLQLEDRQKLFVQFYQEGALRLSQAGHVLMFMCKEDKGRWLQKIKQEVCLPQVRERTYQRLFGGQRQRQGVPMSQFLQDNAFLESSLEFPTLAAVKEYDKVSHKLYPGSLHNLVWLALQQQASDPKLPGVPFDFKLQVFDGLQFSSSNVTTGAPEQLCQLDVDAFFFATVRTASLALDRRRAVIQQSAGDAPLCVPSNIADPLCTEEQAAWWMAVYSLYSNSAKEKLGENRRILQRGLEVIRGIGNHGLDASLVIHMARYFAGQASELKTKDSNGEANSEEISAWEARASHYWNVALTMLDKLASNQALHPPKQRFFPSYSTDPSAEEVAALREEGRLYLACRLIDKGQLDDAAKAFNTLTSAHASFYLALSLKRLAQEQIQEKMKHEVSSQSWNTHIAFLSRARDALYLTLDRVQGNRNHPLTLELDTLIEEVETQLATAERNSAGESEDGLEDGDVALSPVLESKRNYITPPLHRRQHELHHLDHTFPTLHRIQHNLNINTSTPFKRTRPSPERLDAQIRALAYTQDTLVQTVLEQQRELMETNRAIVEELRQNKTVVEQLRKQLEDFQLFSQKSRPRLVKQDSCHVGDRGDAGEEEAEGEDYAEDYVENGYIQYMAASDGMYVRGDYDLAQPHMVMPSAGSSTINYVPHQQPSHTGQYSFQYPPPPQGPSPARISAAATGIPQPRNVYPAVGLHFSDGQQLPQFNFLLHPPPQNAIRPLPPGRPPVFSRLGSQPGLAPSGPPLIESSEAAPWSDRVSAPAPHAFQIPMPLSGSKMVSYNQPPAVLSMPPAISQSPSFLGMPGQPLPTSPAVPTSINGLTMNGSRLQALLNESNAVSSDSASVVAQDVKLAEPKDTHTRRKSSSGADDSSGPDDVEDGDTSRDPDFTPVIFPMPEEVPVLTGEEGEKILFEERAKLYRYIDKEWKERGIGTLKLLCNESVGRVRLLMRREQVLKVCANHYITPNMVLKPRADGDRAWMWVAQDFADEELRPEHFCVRFKTADQALQFKEAFEKSVTLAKESASQSAGSSFVKDQTTSISLDSLGNKSKSSTWKCHSCSRSNSTSQVVCKACGSSNMGSRNAQDTSLPLSGFGDKFRAKPNSWTCQVCLLNNSSDRLECVACTSPKPGTGLPRESGSSYANRVDDVKTSSSVSEGPATKALEDSGSPAGPASFLLTHLANKHGDETVKEKTTYGGFTFTSPPVIQTTVTPERNMKFVTSKSKEFGLARKEDSSAKSSPFANFVPATTDSQVGTKGSKPEVFGSTSNSPSPSFSSLSTGNADSAFKKDPNFKGFVGEGSSVFTTQPKPKVEDHAESKMASADAPEEFVPTVEFKPVVPLPELVSVETGEEEEEKLFGEKGKLFRYDSEGHQWKERGIGEIKILRHTGTQKCRILMRRDQVLKICANHYILPELKLSPLKSSDRAWVWFAKDFSEGEPKHEQLAIKFKSMSIAQEFFQVFEQCQKYVSQGNISLPEEQHQVAKLENLPVDEPSTVQPLSEVFKPKPGSWECEVCMVRNEAASKKCCACEGARPGLPVESKPESQEGLTALAKFSFTLTPVTSQSSTSKPEGMKIQASTPDSKTVFAGKPLNSSTPISSGFVFGTAPPTAFVNKNKSPELSTGQAPKPPSFVFGSVTTSTPIKTSVPQTTQPVLSFKAGETPFVFGSTSLVTSAFSTVSCTPPTLVLSTTSNSVLGNEHSQTTPEAQDGDSVQFRFGSPQKYEFNFSGVRPRSPAKTPKSPGTPSDTYDAGDDEVEPSEADNIFFQPVIPLPPKVDPKTGEEEETVLYCHRTKLYRFTQGEWKERGLGDIKVLRCSTTGRIRLLMRREQVLKVCLNHCLLASTQFSAKGDKTWVWAASDFSEGEAKPEQFAARFKSSEIAQQFYAAVTTAQKTLSQQNQEEHDISKDDGATTPSVASSFSFRLDNVPKTKSPSTAFSLAARFGTSPDHSASIFGGTVPSGSPSIDVEVMYEKKPTPEQKEKACKLHLPLNFFSYEDKEPCPGCRGCRDEIPPWKSTSEASVTETEQKLVPRTSEDLSKTVAPSGPFSLPVDYCTQTFESLATKSISFLSPGSSNKVVSFPGAGTPVFNISNKDDSTQEGEDQVSPSPDIHFEPVVPMPDLVEAHTGEEDEDVVFSQRAKLYRYDAGTHQWKERGIGDFKILKHKEKDRYRLLLRREQVYKVACNHYITPSMVLSPLPTSEKALCWKAIDYAEGNPVMEEFALRFKTKELLDSFRETFQDCISRLQSKGAEVEPTAKGSNLKESDQTPHSGTPAVVDASSVCSVAPEVLDGLVSGQEEKADDEAEECSVEEEDEDETMFEKRATLHVHDSETNQYKMVGMGMLTICYDDRVFGARIRMRSDQGDTLCDNIIAVQTCLRIVKNKACWAALDLSVDPPQRKEYQAVFSSNNAVEEFSKVFEEGKEMAMGGPIIENEDALPHGIAHGVPGQIEVADTKAVSSPRKTVQPVVTTAEGEKQSTSPLFEETVRLEESDDSKNFKVLGSGSVQLFRDPVTLRTRIQVKTEGGNVIYNGEATALCVIHSDDQSVTWKTTNPSGQSLPKEYRAKFPSCQAQQFCAMVKQMLQ